MLSQDLTSRIKDFADGADAETLRETLDVIVDAAAKGDFSQVEDAFYTDLDFGTGGLRGIMGPGTNRMNRSVVARATQGLVNYIKEAVGDASASVCIAFDSRNRSEEFAREAACVIAGNGVKAYLFRELRPTPELSFAVKYFGATAGIVITASHNPKEYNGYKVSWSDGGQVVAPQDRGIIEKVRQVTAAGQIHRADYESAVASGLIVLVGPEVDDAFLAAMDVVRLQPDLAAARGSELKIVYTPLHGTGITMVPKALERWGFTSVACEPRQSVPDGNFPTTKSPNPEEKAAMALALELAERTGADVVFATDPDADRVGVAVRRNDKFELLTGNQVGSLMTYYLCEVLKERGKLPSDGVFIKTIVTTELISAIAGSYGVEVDDCLTGFKYIAELIRRYEEQGAPGKPSKTFIMGSEESYGYLIGTHARDKDAVVATCVLAEMALWAKIQGKTLLDLLHDVFARYGVYIESQQSHAMKGMTGMQQIAALMERLRKESPATIAGIPVVEVVDIQRNVIRDLKLGTEKPGLGLPQSNVLIFKLGDGSTIVARPSGTEPKIKFYFMVVDKEGFPLQDRSGLEERIRLCQEKERKLLAEFDRLTQAG